MNVNPTQYARYCAFFTNHNCSIETSEKEFLESGEFAYLCARGEHTYRMAAKTASNKITFINKGTAKVCGYCDLLDRARADVEACGHTLIEYQNPPKIRYTCGNCGNESQTTIANIRKNNSRTCKHCMHSQQRNSYEKVVAKVQAAGMKLLMARGEYRINKQIRVECRCGAEWQASLNDIVRGKTCRTCGSERRAATNQERYGAPNVFASDTIKAKIRKKNQEKHGVDYPMQNPEILKKTKATNRARLGVEYAFTQPWVRDKIKQTNLERYGVEYPLQSIDQFRQVMEQCGRAKFFTFPSGRTVQVLGYEPRALEYLLETYEEKEIEVENVPSIQYDNGRTYWPDFFLPEENCVVEVKSPWSLTLITEKIIDKFVATLEAGYGLRLLVVNHEQQVIRDEQLTLADRADWFKNVVPAEEPQDDDLDTSARDLLL